MDGLMAGWYWCYWEQMSKIDCDCCCDTYDDEDDDIGAVEWIWVIDCDCCCDTYDDEDVCSWISYYVKVNQSTVLLTAL